MTVRSFERNPAANPPLEVMECHPESGEVRETPIVFIHGAYVAAWCWEDYFLPYFASRGYRTYAVSLRGHGASGARERLPWISLQEYVADVEWLVEQLDTVPILVGHSMGGMVVQKYLETHRVPAAVLMASAPPEGLLFAAWWLVLSNPLLFWELNLLAMSGPYLSSVDGVRRAIFSGDIPRGRVAGYMRRAQQESLRAIVDMSWLNLPRRNARIKSPMLVMGGEDDALIPVPAVESTARAYGVRAEIFPGTGHAMMLDEHWRPVAERIGGWFADQGL
jgi:non-heme chloroperoxidase